MGKTPIAETLADNLRQFMKDKGVTQKDLAAKTGIGQTTISLYLRPDDRNATTSGSAPSPTLTRIQALADALDVQLWELVSPLSPAQRALIKSIDAVIAEQTPPPPAAPADAAPPPRKRKAA